jgi:UDP:flavonoid glycosyltransferase YjiC (YdhE family)
MKNFSGNLCDLYTEADRVLFADSRELVPTYRAPEHHHYLGPILWSTPGKLPDKCRTLDRNKPTVFVTLGSSGPTKVLDTVLAGLLSLGSDLNILLATSKRVDVGPAITNLPNVVVADYLPAREASEMSDMVICHGGSASAYVALAEGKPVLGIPSLLDQHLTIEYVKIRRAGESLRSEYVSVSAIAELVSKMIRDDRLRQHAGLIAQEFRKYEPAKTFSDLINLHIRKNGQGGTLTASQVDHSVLQNTVTKQLFSGFTPIGSSPTVRNAKQ